MGIFKLLERLGRIMITPGSGCRTDTGLGIIVELLAIFLSIASPFGLKIAVDAFSRGDSFQNIWLVIFGVIIFIAFWACSAVLKAFKMTFTTRLCNALTCFILKRALRTQLPLIATERNGDSGKFQGIFERLPYSLQTIIEGLLWSIVPLALQVVLTIVVVAIGVSWKFAALMLLILIVHAFVSYRASEQYERQAMKANTAAGTLSGALGDLLRNAQRAVFNGQGGQEIEQVGQVAVDKNVSDVRMAMLLVKACAWQFGVIGFGIGVLLVLGALDVLNGSITTGDFVMLQTYVLSFAAPVASYGYVLRQAGIAAENVDDALNYMADDTGSHDNEITLAISTTAVSVSGCNLHFSYNGRPAISDLNVEVPAGVFAVVMGPNGSGKSTLAKLLAGLLKPDNGMIKIGEYNPSDFSRHGSRNILYIPQQISLFNRTLQENALYPPTALQKDELRDILSELTFYDDERVIDLDLHVGEQGGRLSRGQLQKLEMARISQVNIPAIILDETTSALDSRSEETTIKLLRNHRRGKSTILMISHRIYAAENADVVIFMKSGRVIATGKHTELMENNAEYYDFWEKEGSELEN
ncbi:ATP-binding cassette domain-containing protein [Klebsiella pneumoniae]